jgi:hypothetical protein
MALEPYYERQPADFASSAAQLYEDSQGGGDAVAALQVGSLIPDFTADSSEGEIEFYVDIDGGWTLFVTFHKTFDAVATTEVAALAKLMVRTPGPRAGRRKFSHLSYVCP